MTVAMLYRDELKEYDFGSGHPFRGDRFEEFLPFLKSRLNSDGNYQILPATWATDEDLLKICDPDYISFNKEFYHAAYGGWGYYYENFSRYQSPDNKPIGNPGKLEWAARLIVGQAKMACDLVQNQKYQKVVSIGGGLHHAKRRFGEGFCLYNDVAFAAIYLIEKYKLDRILILDTDAHAANGTQEYFNSDPRVLLIDLHQDPRTIYPGTGFASSVGSGEGRGFTVNIPLPISAGDGSYQLAFDEIVLPLTHEFKPQIIIRNGGSDPYFNDGLANLGLTIAGFRMVGDKVREMTSVCQGKQIDLIASGYNKKILPYGWLSLISGIANFPITLEEPEPVPQRYHQDLVLMQTQQAIAEVKHYHREFWKSLR